MSGLGPTIPHRLHWLVSPELCLCHWLLQCPIATQDHAPCACYKPMSLSVVWEHESQVRKGWWRLWVPLRCDRQHLASICAAAMQVAVGCPGGALATVLLPLRPPHGCGQWAHCPSHSTCVGKPHE